MDRFKEKQIKVAGCMCESCNIYHGKAKNKLNKTARKKLKEEDRKNATEVN